MLGIISLSKGGYINQVVESTTWYLLIITMYPRTSLTLDSDLTLDKPCKRGHEQAY